MKRPFISVLHNNVATYIGMGIVWTSMAILELVEPSGIVTGFQLAIFIVAGLLLAYTTISTKEDDDEMSREHLGTAMYLGFLVMNVICLAILILTHFNVNVPVRVAAFLILGLGCLSTGLLFYYQERPGE